MAFMCSRGIYKLTGVLLKAWDMGEHVGARNKWPKTVFPFLKSLLHLGVPRKTLFFFILPRQGDQLRF